ncbi:MAG: hypothetical protein M1837_001789 [Sclerophora amabilis]|nr:MAG: hypothetical protein M1837_001789 [Sclerophora amabilis]
MASSTAAKDADVLQNKVNLFLANQQRLLASWLPPRTPEETANLKSREELEKEEEEIFTPVPTTLGVGAQLPTDHEKRRRLTSEDQLRRKLLGKNARKSHVEHPKSELLRSTPPTAKGLGQGSLHDESDSEEDGGRSSLGRAKRQKVLTPREDGIDGQTPTISDVGEKTVASSKESSARKGRGNFLDEVLVQKSQKKKRKRKTKAAISDSEKKTAA